MSRNFNHGAIVEGFDFESKAIGEQADHWVIEGYASVFGNTDLGNDVVEPGAFKKSLEKRTPLLLFNHKMEDAPIGTVTDAKEDKKGLWFKAELPKDDEFVRGRIYPQLKRRGLKGTSIGYRPTEKSVRKDGVRSLKTIDLFEISIVNMPMNPLAGVESLKGFVGFQDHFVDHNVTEWDRDATMKKLLAKFGSNAAELKQFFLYVDEEKEPQQWDSKLLIADIDDNGRIATNRIALFKAAANVAGAREGVDLPEVAEDAVKDTLERYYRKLDLDTPWKSLSNDEYDALTVGELESRLRGLGISRKLATRITGLRDADRKSAQRDAALKGDANRGLLDAFANLIAAAQAIKTST